MSSQEFEDVLAEFYAAIAPLSLADQAEALGRLVGDLLRRAPMYREPLRFLGPPPVDVKAEVARLTAKPPKKHYPPGQVKPFDGRRRMRRMLRRHK